MAKKTIAAFLILALSFLILVAVMIATGHASTTSGNRRNSLGVTETLQNPNTYLLALPLDGQVLEGKYTNIRFQPYGTPALYDESILFCGNVTDYFQDKTGVVVVVYETQAHTMYRGVPCKTLVATFEIK
jgi:hypothetical protein